MATLAATRRADLSDAQWAVLEPQLPARQEARTPAGTCETAAHQRDPVADPDRRAVARRAAGLRAVADGLWPVPALAAERDLAGDPDRPAGPGRCGRADHLDVPVDSTVARAHQHAAGARKRGDLQAEPPGGVQDEPADHGLGRSRGGLTTKVHLACEQRQKPLSVVITAGQRGDSPQFQPVLEAIAVPRSGPGRARTRPDRVLADKAYGSRANRAYLRRRGIRCTSAWTRHPRRRGPRGTRSSGPAGLMRHLTNGRVTAMCHPRTVAAQLADLACL